MKQNDTTDFMQWWNSMDVLYVWIQLQVRQQAEARLDSAHHLTTSRLPVRHSLKQLSSVIVCCCCSHVSNVNMAKSRHFFGITLSNIHKYSYHNIHISYTCNSSWPVHLECFCPFVHTWRLWKSIFTMPISWPSL